MTWQSDDSQCVAQPNVDSALGAVTLLECDQMTVSKCSRLTVDARSGYGNADMLRLSVPGDMYRRLGRSAYCDSSPHYSEYVALERSPATNASLMHSDSLHALELPRVKAVSSRVQWYLV